MDFKEIRKLITLIDEAALTEIEVEEGGRRIRIRKEAPRMDGGVSPQPVAREVPATQASVAEEARFALIRSPIVGTFYRSASPGTDPYVEMGDLVKKGQTLCIVEAMKLLNEIESDVDGTVAAICVEDGVAVEYGAPLFKIEPPS